VSAYWWVVGLVAISYVAACLFFLYEERLVAPMKKSSLAMTIAGCMFAPLLVALLWVGNHMVDRRERRERQKITESNGPCPYLQTPASMGSANAGKDIMELQQS
jgi:membrane protein implicated in regulation of membrane protease activity